MKRKSKNVYRVDGKYDHGYQVRVLRHGKMYSRLFSDNKYGGKKSTFRKAVAYRAKLIAEIDTMPGNGPRRLLVLHNKSNSSGVVGISRKYRHNSNSRGEVYAISWYPEPGIRRGTTYSIKKFGEDTAFKMACKLRFEKMKEIHGDRYEVASYMELYRQKAAVDKKARSGK